MPHVRHRVGPDLSRPIFLQRPYYPQGRRDVPSAGYGFGVRSGDWKYFEAEEEGRRELYNLHEDRGERIDVSATAQDKTEEMSGLIREWRARQKGGLAESALTPRDEAALEALGYGVPASK